MHITYATFHNIGPFAHFEQAFKRGLVGIFGPNGAGKSTMVNLIYACLTNDFSRFPGVKADCILDTAGLKEPSYVEVNAEHNGIKYWIRRNLRPTKPGSALKIEGEKEITNANDIDARLRNELGVDMKLIDKYVFVDQWRMFDFLEMTPAVRAEAFKHLCRTYKADVIFKACEKVIAKYTPESDVVDNSDELAAKIGESTAKIMTLGVQQDELKDRLLNEKSLASAQRLVRYRERWIELTEELPEVQKKYEKRQRILAQRHKKLQRDTKTLRLAEEVLVRRRQEAAGADAALKTWETYEKRKKRRAKLQQDLVDLAAEKESKPAPPKPDDYDSKSRYSTFLANARNDKSKAVQVVQTFEATQSGECPTCHQKIDHSHVERFKGDITRCDNVIKKMKPRLDAFEKWETDHKGWTAWKSGWDARVRATEEELAGFKDLKEPSGDKAALQQAVQALQDVERGLAVTRKTCQESQNALTEMETKVSETKQRLADMGAKITKYTVDDKLHVRAEQRLAEHRAAELERSQLQGQIDALVAQQHEDEAALDKLRAVLKRQKRLRRVLKTLAEARDVFHWSRLPNRVAQGNLVLMEDDVNGTLAWMGDPFFVEAQEGLTFHATKHGHLPRRAEWLSGGEKGILAIAFRYGANALFRTDIGTMWLDEPTAALADENVVYFREALERMAAEVRGKRQLCVITHAGQLGPAFDQVIEVNP